MFNSSKCFIHIYDTSTIKMCSNLYFMQLRIPLKFFEKIEVLYLPIYHNLQFTLFLNKLCTKHESYEGEWKRGKHGTFISSGLIFGV